MTTPQPGTGDRTIDDEFGNEWSLCARPECGLQIVRPGKVQCWCDSEDGPLADADFDQLRAGEPQPGDTRGSTAALLRRCDEVEADTMGRHGHGGHVLPAVLSTSVIRALLAGGEQS